MFYKDTGGYFPVNCPVNVLYPLGLPAFCARKTGGKSGFFKQVETLLRIYLLFYAIKSQGLACPLKGAEEMGEKLKLYGFNNLTKALSFNIYDVCYAKTPREQRDYISYIDEQYNSERLTNILTTLTDMIGAKVLNLSLIHI